MHQHADVYACMCMRACVCVFMQVDGVYMPPSKYSKVQMQTLV